MGRGSTPSKRGEESANLYIKGLLLSLGISLFFLWYLLFRLDVSASNIVHRVLLPLLRLFSIIVITLTLSAVVEGMGWSKAIARYARPLTKVGGFSDYVAIAFTTAFLSGVAANTMLLNAYEEGRISQRELLLANLLNTGLPSYFLHLPTTIAIIVPLVGQAGAIYLGITFFAALVRTIFITFIGRMLLGPRGGAPALLERGPGGERPRRGQVYGWPLAKRLVHRYLVGRVLRIVYYTVPIYLAVVVAQDMGVFQWLQQKSTQMFPVGGVPIESMSIVAFTILAEFTAGAAAAGAMVHSGILSIKETVLALVLGNVVATPFRAIRHQLPRYIGIYRPRLGLTLLVAGQGLRLASVIVVTFVYVVMA